MKNTDIFKLSVNSLTQRGLRSWLTILGIIIGVAAVVAILSMGAGMEKSISSQLGGLGADIVTITPGFNRAVGFRGHGGGFDGMDGSGSDSNLTVKDTQIIKSVSGVDIVNGIVSGRVDVSYLAETASLSVKGVDPLIWSEMTTTSDLESGRYLSAGDGNVVVIGNTIAEETFKQPLLINTQIEIEGKSFRIVGILEESGMGDSTIFMPASQARIVIEGFESDQFSSIEIKVSDTGDEESEYVSEVSEKIEEKLLLSRHVTEDTKDFTITSSQAIQEMVSEMMGTMNLFLGGIAAISLLVGAIGIANTMFMSVMERTRQIGVLKALGTTNNEIMKLFLIESGIIGFMGGLIGIFFGIIASGMLTLLGGGMGPGARGGMTTVVEPELIMFAMAFSIVIGIISGLIPAMRAAELQPVEALRYE